jgi:hypothetical protein
MRTNAWCALNPNSEPSWIRNRVCPRSGNSFHAPWVIEPVKWLGFAHWLLMPLKQNPPLVVPNAFGHAKVWTNFS